MPCLGRSRHELPGLYFQEDDLLEAAVETDLVVVLDVCPGSLLVPGTPI